MYFTIVHTTRYLYASPATESFMEMRLVPQNNDKQRLIRRTLTLEPEAIVNQYVDFYGNQVENFSIIHRNPSLVIRSESEVETLNPDPNPEALDLTLSEARQLFHSQAVLLFDFLSPSRAIALDRQVNRIANRFFPPTAKIGPAVTGLLTWMDKAFTYRPGSTSIDTPVPTVLRNREGVCQDFAHVMIAILRSAGIPARYVCGYIETENERRAAENPETPLRGASESHAWVEVFLPGGYWLPVDPTNNCVAGERHVTIAAGRDFFDTSPTRGVFKGTTQHQLKASVTMTRQVRS
jgi:transglutaminase-like putative cysteine protease